MPGEERDMDRKTWTRLNIFVVVLLAIVCQPAAAQDTKSSLTLPDNPRVWLNSPPYSLEMLKGKGVLLYFFEEG